MDSSFKEIGQRLKHYMEQRGLNVNKLAHAVNLPAKKITKIIDGKEYSLKKVLLLMEVLSDMSQVWLLTGVGNMTDKEPQKKKENISENKITHNANPLKDNFKSEANVLKQIVKNQEILLKQNKTIISLLEKKSGKMKAKK